MPRPPYRFRAALLRAPFVFLRAVDFLLEVDFRPVLRFAELPPEDFLAEDVRAPEEVFPLEAKLFELELPPELEREPPPDRLELEA